MQGQDWVEVDAAAGWAGLAAALGAARAGDEVRLAAGEYSGSEPLRVPAGVTLSAAPGARLRWAGSGSALRLHQADGAAVRGLATAMDPAGLAGLPTISTYALILIKDSAWVDIAGCTLTGGGDHLHGVLVRRGRAIAVRDCEVGGCRTGILFGGSTVLEGLALGVQLPAARTLAQIRLLVG